ncbi:SAM-dependent methyltransferase DSY4148 (UbiE paralog) [Amycolatopsis camponoti]|uniref:SAM-dependent methyltransferase DSY4148 (UbiE paralog) n=1 Tax=Amycolatopsis camponoti TaxID=2606593 RepID=A0A6I8LN98_9PSEU|nr:SAM-dependent methyltransferase DSY4148 (UbiE paralog) [Amycolatopsis camponoti]
MQPLVGYSRLGDRTRSGRRPLQARGIARTARCPPAPPAGCLSVDKPAVFAETHRVLVLGGRIGITNVVADDHLTPAPRAVTKLHEP